MQSAIKALVGRKEPCWSATLVRNGQDVAGLFENSELLVGRDCCLSRPDFFIASVSPKWWIPRIVVVRRRDHFIGALYAKERKLAGVPTGIIYSDATLNGMVMAEVQNRSAVFDGGLRALLKSPRTLGIRLTIPPHGYEREVLEELVSDERLHYAAVPRENHMMLQLGEDYEGFLNGLGSRTRRNFRYYRRKSEHEGHVYVEDVRLNEFRTAAETLLKQKVVGADRDSISRALAMFACCPRPILTGLRDKDGNWLSILGGWIEGTRPLVFFQMNSDKNHKQLSLSLVLRSYFLESLIRQGFRDVIFWAGVGAPLHYYATPISGTSVYLDRSYNAWSTFRRLAAGAIKKLPRNMAWSATWLIPDVERTIRTRPPLA